VTATVTRRAKPGHEALCERFLAGIIAAASEFPGHLGVEVFRPTEALRSSWRAARSPRPESPASWRQRPAAHGAAAAAHGRSGNASRDGVIADGWAATERPALTGPKPREPANSDRVYV
jgi:hypothetical protein